VPAHETLGGIAHLHVGDLEVPVQAVVAEPGTGVGVEEHEQARIELGRGHRSRSLLDDR